MKKVKIYPFQRDWNLSIDIFMLMAIVTLFFILLFLEQSLFIRVAIFLGFCIVNYLLQFFNFLTNKNFCSFALAFSKKKVRVFYNPLLFKTFSLDVYDKITLQEYINYPMRCPKRRYSGWRSIEVDAVADKNQIVYLPVFVIYKEEIKENFVWSERENKPLITQECFNAFVEKVMNTKMILLDATFKNYCFLRQFYKKENFVDKREKKEFLLEEFEKLFEDKLVRQ